MGEEEIDLIFYSIQSWEIRLQAAKSSIIRGGIESLFSSCDGVNVAYNRIGIG
jgi:hypothetical protein